MSEDRLPSRNPAPPSPETGGGMESLPASASSGDSFPLGSQAAPSAADPERALRARLHQATKSGAAFELLKAEYADADGDWTTIQSDDPFEVLYLDHEAWEKISPILIEERSAVLQAFWEDVLRRMNSGATRQMIAAKYGGESALKTYPTKLEHARRMLATEADIKGEHARIESDRVEKGKARLLKSLEPLLAAGSIPPASLHAIAADLEAMGFRTSEGGAILKEVLRVRGFAPEREIFANTAEDVASVRWSTVAADRMEEIRQNDLYMRLGLGSYSPYARDRTGNLTPQIVDAAHRARATWWRAQPDRVVVGADQCTPAEALDRIDSARTKLLSELAAASASVPPVAASPPTTAAPQPISPRHTGRYVMAAAAMLAIGVAWLATGPFSSAPATLDVASSQVPGPLTEAQAPNATVPVESLVLKTTGRLSGRRIKNVSARAAVVPVVAPVDSAREPQPPKSAEVPPTPLEEGETLLSEASNYLGAKSPGRAYVSAQGAARVVVKALRAGAVDPALETLRVRAENVQRLALQLCDDTSDTGVNRTRCP